MIVIVSACGFNGIILIDLHVCISSVFAIRTIDHTLVPIVHRYAIDQLMHQIQHICQFKYLFVHLVMCICHLLKRYWLLENPVLFMLVIAREIATLKKCHFQDLSFAKTSTVEMQALTMILDVSSLCFSNRAF